MVEIDNNDNNNEYIEKHYFVPEIGKIVIRFIHDDTREIFEKYTRLEGYRYNKVKQDV